MERDCSSSSRRYQMEAGTPQSHPVESSDDDQAYPNIVHVLEHVGMQPPPSTE